VVSLPKCIKKSFGGISAKKDKRRDQLGSSYYWSSTSIVGIENSTWIVNFNNGNVNGNNKDK